MGRVRWVTLGCSALATLVRAGAASAEPLASPPTYALSWVRAEGAEECPSNRALMTEVERRLGRAVFDLAAERAFEVAVTRSGGTFRSDVFLRDESGHALGHRTLQSDEPGCAPLLNATALAIALVIDPEAAAREPAPGKSAVAFEAPASPPAPPPPPAPTPVASRPTVVVVERPAPAPLPREPLSVSMRADVSGGLVPAASPGVELSFSARPFQRWGFALTGAYTAPQNAVLGVGSLDLGLTRAAGLVTFQAASLERVQLGFGLGVSLGAFHVAVREPVPATAPGDYLFAAVEGALTLQIFVTKRIFIDLGGSAFVPLKRQQFLVRGQTDTVWGQPLLFGRGFFGVGVMFP